MEEGPEGGSRLIDKSHKDGFPQDEQRGLFSSGAALQD
jgi:hypothetical protein